MALSTEACYNMTRTPGGADNAATSALSAAVPSNPHGREVNGWSFGLFRTGANREFTASDAARTRSFARRRHGHSAIFESSQEMGSASQRSQGILKAMTMPVLYAPMPNSRDTASVAARHGLKPF